MSLETHQQSSMHINPVALSEQGCPSDRNCSLQSYVHRVMEVLAELEVVVLGKDCVVSLVRLALDAQESFFAAALFHPDEAHLDHFFHEFVRLSAVPTHGPSPPSVLTNAFPATSFRSNDSSSNGM
jgi:hypothetical protein